MRQVASRKPPNGMEPIPFKPLPFLGPHAQTILGARLSFAAVPPSSTRRVPLPDGDQIALEMSTPDGWQPTDRTAVLIHGLCGCDRSPYLVRIAAKLWRRGVRAVRMNLRGCGTGKGLARNFYHSGRSEDAAAVLESLRAEWPHSPTTLVGFSLGGNIALKLGGELEEDAARLLDQIIAVCAPVDLLTCSRRFSLPFNRFYERYFVRLLKADVTDHLRRFPDLPPVSFPPRLSLYEFDDLFTAPRCGFRDATDYYTRASSKPLVPKIHVRCRLLFAGDDPLVDGSVLDEIALPSNVDIVRTTHGGHLGFLGTPGHPGGVRWMDAKLLEWIG